MFNPFIRGVQQQQQGQPSPPSQSWYPPFDAVPANSGPSRLPPPPPNFGAYPSGINPLARHPITDARSSLGGYFSSPASYSGAYPPPTSTSVPSSGTHSSYAGAYSSVASLKDKSSEELARLLNDRDAYDAFLHSLDEVKRLDTINAELKKSIVDESKTIFMKSCFTHVLLFRAENNLVKESEIAELRTQCMIIRNTELAASRERFEELDNRYKEVQANCSPSALLHKLKDAVSKVDEDSENLHYKFLAGEIELVEFIQKYRQHRLLYHRRSLIRLAALSSSTTPG
ncbi:vacuolar protein-sorting-associated protein 37 homolog 2 isoform X2 [Physcomitrium patens]